MSNSMALKVNGKVIKTYKVECKLYGKLLKIYYLHVRCRADIDGILRDLKLEHGKNIESLKVTQIDGHAPF